MPTDANPKSNPRLIFFCFRARFRQPKAGGPLNPMGVVCRDEVEIEVYPCHKRPLQWGSRPTHKGAKPLPVKPVSTPEQARRDAAEFFEEKITGWVRYELDEDGRAIPDTIYGIES